LEEQLPNRVLMLEDTNADGVFDRSTIFADKMTFPQGSVLARRLALRRVTTPASGN
jgi:hypothetical protein